MDALTSEEVASAAGCSYRMLDYWVRIGVLEPDVPARGSGSARRWSSRSLRTVRAVARLRALGAPADVLRSASAALRLRADAGGLVQVTTAGDLVPLGAAGDGWVLDLDPEEPARLAG